MNEAVVAGDTGKLIRYVRLHFGGGGEENGRKEIGKAWIEALNYCSKFLQRNASLYSKL